MIIKPGDRFHSLVVVQKMDRKWNSYDVWECRCDCGNITTPSSYALLKGETKNCGRRMGHVTDLVGQKFGKLTEIGRAHV